MSFQKSAFPDSRVHEPKPALKPAVFLPNPGSDSAELEPGFQQWVGKALFGCNPKQRHEAACKCIFQVNCLPFGRKLATLVQMADENADCGI